GSGFGSGFGLGFGAGSGPARYWTAGHGAPVLGVITPMSRHFCAACNRVRLGVDGTLYLCLGQEDQVPLGRMLRAGATDAALTRAILAGIAAKPERHDFLAQPDRIVRFMAQTGG
ncbi:MAG TPA: GTP 3',8-cyclase MoaA, partial [Achromobacter sp.]|nr:GTP 3',8-cyclase MoaA [Achromobacter sp.]